MTKLKVPNIWKVPRGKKCPKIITSEVVINSGETLGGSGGVMNTKITPYSPEGKMLTVLLAEIKGDTQFRPNLQDKRVLNRTKDCLDWCIRHQARNRVSHKSLDKVFGQSQNHTSFWLRSKLLNKLRGHSKDKGKAAEWQVNIGGVKSLWFEIYGEEINLEQEEFKAWERASFQYGKGPFEYTEPVKGGRRYHEMQQLPKKYRGDIWRGYYEYDLSAANVTLITQQAKAIYENLQTPRLDKYLFNKGPFRAALAAQFGVSLTEAKELVQCVISLATFNTTDFSHAYTVLSHKKFAEFVHHPYFQEMRAEIQECWRVLLPKEWADGEARFRKYEQIERLIIDVCEQHLRGKNYLLQHDGFLLMEREPLNLPMLTAAIEAQTGYIVGLEEKAL